MRTFTRAILGIVVAAVVILGAITVLSNTVLADSSLADTIGTSTTNALIDASGIKERVESALRDKASSIAAATGLSEDEVDAIIDQLDISSWTVTTLPDDAVATGSFTASYAGTTGTVTTYADSSYVTVEAYGQNITLEVPASAQSYLSYLSYLN